MCSVFLPEEERVVNILGEHLEPVTPAQGDRVKVSGIDCAEVAFLLLVEYLFPCLPEYHFFPLPFFLSLSFFFSSLISRLAQDPRK